MAEINLVIPRGITRTLIWILAKGNYSYEYMDGRDKFLLTELPLIGAYYSSLSEETINSEEYERAQKV